MHGFYAVMGGIAFEIPENLPESERFLPSRTVESWFVNHNWIRSLLEKDIGHELIPDLSEEEIKSKSKASNLAKALVCIQVLWFIAQCFTRRTWENHPCKSLQRIVKGSSDIFVQSHNVFPLVY